MSGDMGVANVPPAYCAKEGGRNFVATGETDTAGTLTLTVFRRKRGRHHSASNSSTRTPRPARKLARAFSIRRRKARIGFELILEPIRGNRGRSEISHRLACNCYRPFGQTSHSPILSTRFYQPEFAPRSSAFVGGQRSPADHRRSSACRLPPDTTPAWGAGAGRLCGYRGRASTVVRTASSTGVPIVEAQGHALSVRMAIYIIDGRTFDLAAVSGAYLVQQNVHPLDKNPEPELRKLGLI
jgi:hypothetical protein